MAELARRARLDQSAVTRLLHPVDDPRRLNPGPRSIAGLLLAFTDRFPSIGFYDLFKLVDDDGRVIAPTAPDEGDDEQVSA